MNEKPLRRIILKRLGINVLITIREHFHDLKAFLDYTNGKPDFIGRLQIRLSDYGPIEPYKFERYDAREKAIKKGRIKPTRQILSE